MRRNLPGILGIISVGTIVTGCVIVSRPVIDPYRAPDASLPSAQLIVLPAKDMDRYSSEQLNRHYVQCQPNGEQNRRLMGLAWFGASSQVKPVEVTLPVGRSYFQYVKMMNQESCTINFSAQLEPGHAYAFKTELEYKGWLKGKNCLVGLFEANTRLPVPLDYEGSTPSPQGMCTQQVQPKQAQR